MGWGARTVNVLKLSAPACEARLEVVQVPFVAMLEQLKHALEVHAAVARNLLAVGWLGEGHTHGTMVDATRLATQPKLRYHAFFQTGRPSSPTLLLRMLMSL